MWSLDIPTRRAHHSILRRVSASPAFPDTPILFTAAHPFAPRSSFHHVARLTASTISSFRAQRRPAKRGSFTEPLTLVDALARNQIRVVRNIIARYSPLRQPSHWCQTRVLEYRLDARSTPFVRPPGCASPNTSTPARTPPAETRSQAAFDSQARLAHDCASNAHATHFWSLSIVALLKAVASSPCRRRCGKTSSP